MMGDKMYSGMARKTAKKRVYLRILKNIFDNLKWLGITGCGRLGGGLRYA